MLIDGFTVVAQMVNFLILMALFRRYLYKPILSAIDQREKTIASTLEDAEAKQKEADQQRDTFTAQNAKFKEQREELLGKARENAEKEGQKVLDTARTEAEKLMAKRLTALEEKEKDLCQTLYSRAQKEAFELARNVLKSLGDVDVQGKMVERFLERLSALDEAERQMFTSEKSENQTLVVRSAFELTTPQQKSLEKAISPLLVVESPLKFEMVSDLVAGLELVSGGYKLSWNIKDALNNLENEAKQAS